MREPDAGDDPRSFWAGVALGFLLATAMRAFLSTLWYLSLVTLRLNGSAAWILALLAPLLVPLVGRSRAPTLLAAAATAALPFARFTGAFVATCALASGAGALALAQRGPSALLGALVGIAANGALLLAGDSHDPLLSPAGALLALFAGVVALARPPGPAPARGGGAALAWAALLAAQLALLATPFALARATGAAPWAAFVASAAGLGAGAFLARSRMRGVLAALAALALVDVALLRGPLVLVSVGALQAALVAAASRLRAPSPGVFALALTAGLFALLYFGQALGAAEPALALGLAAALTLGAAWLAPRPGRRATQRLRVALLLALVALPFAFAAPPPAAEPTDELTVVSWNVHQGFGNRGALDPELYAEALRRMGADVVILQEADTARLSSGGLDVARYLAAALDMRLGPGARDVAVLSRHPVAATDDPSVFRVDLGDASVHLHGVHLARSPAERLQEVDAILRAANETPGARILAGDLNSCAAAPCFGGRPPDGVHERLAVVYLDTWNALHDPADPAGNTHPAASPRRRIDVVMVRGFEVLESGPVRDDLTALGSDHLPVRARLRLA